MMSFMTLMVQVGADMVVHEGRLRVHMRANMGSHEQTVMCWNYKCTINIGVGN